MFDIVLRENHLLLEGAIGNRGSLTMFCVKDYGVLAKNLTQNTLQNEPLPVKASRMTKISSKTPLKKAAILSRPSERRNAGPSYTQQNPAFSRGAPLLFDYSVPEVILLLLL